MKTKLLAFAALALLATSAFAATPIYIWRFHIPGVKGAAAAPASPLLPTGTSVFATWNPSDMGTYMTLSGGNLVAVGNGSGWASVRATQSVSSGKWYWESTISGANGTSSGWYIGAGDSAFGLNNVVGTTANSLGWVPSWGSTYPLSWSGATASIAPAAVVYPVGTTFMVAMDMDNGAVYLGVNGVWNGGGVPTSGATKTGAALVGITGTVFPAVSSASTQSTADFGATAFKYPVPSGYHAGVFQ